MDNKVRTMEFAGIDDWARPVYQCKENGLLWKDITLGEKEPELFSCGNDFDGEPDCPINPQLKIVFEYKHVVNEHTLNYQMLGRLKTDCEYYLEFGSKNPCVLYYKDEKEQIKEMKKLYESFPADKKPEWLTWEQLLDYEKLLVGKISKSKQK